MKRLLTLALCLVMAITMCVTFASCTKKPVEADLWKTATYANDTELGEGSTLITVALTVEDKTVTFTLHTNKKTLGDALMEHKLIAGEKGPYGMYVKNVNGIEADYDKTKTYWGFNKDGESMLTGVDSEKIANGNKYEIVYTKEGNAK